MRTFTEALKRENVTLTAYLHDKSPEMRSAAVRPAMLVFPGGGYSSCSDREAEPIALAYMAEGYNAFVLRYTVGESTSVAEAIADAQAAIQRLHAQAAQWDIDPEKIAVIGFSAGGHLAAMLGSTGFIRPNALILAYPCITADMGKAIGRELPSADAHVDDKTPPTFIFSTRDDYVVPIHNSLAFADALDRHGIPFEMHIFAKGPHGLALAKPLTANGKMTQDNPHAAQWFGLSVAWLKSLLGDFEAGLPYSMQAEEMDGYTLETPLAILLTVEVCCQILAEEVPALYALAQQREEPRQASLSTLAKYMPDIFPEGKLDRLSERLSRIEPT